MAKAGARLYYGCDYNPEQWSAEVVDEDIELMKQAGVTLVTLGVFSWALLEPREGHYDFGWLDEIVDKLEAAGIDIDMATGTASPPAWLSSRYEETLPVTANGVRLSPGSRQAYCPSSRIFRTRAAKLAGAMAARYAHRPSVVMWHVSNEYGCHVSECFCRASKNAFRRWLKQRYGSLDELNRVWGTKFWSQYYYDWNNIPAPRATPTFPNPQHLLDWRRFSDEQMRQCYLAEVEAIRAVDPAARVMTNFMNDHFPTDYRAWAKEMDLITNDSYPDPASPYAVRTFAYWADLMRGLGDGAPFIQLEQAVNGVQWRPANATLRPGQYRQWSLQTMARGADGICNFQWRASVAGAETFHSSMIPHAGADTRVHREVRELGGDIQRLSASGALAGKPVDARAAIILDWPSRWAAHHSHGPISDDVFAEAARWHATLFEHSIPADIAFVDSDLSAYQVVIVPALFQLSDAFAARLAELAAAGTQVLITYYSGLVDDDAHARLCGYLSPLADTWGITISEFAPILGVDAGTGGTGDGQGSAQDGVVDPPSASRPGAEPISTAARAYLPERVFTLDNAMEASAWQEQIDLRCDDVEVVARFSSGPMAGQPAITRRAVTGGGHAWYVGTRLGAAARWELLQQVAAGTEVAPLIADLPAGVGAAARGELLFVFNYNAEPVEVNQAHLAAAATVLGAADPDQLSDVLAGAQAGPGGEGGREAEAGPGGGVVVQNIPAFGVLALRAGEQS